jgi:hypothetical protein
MDQFDPQIPGLMEGDVTSVAVTDPQPFVGGVGNHVIDPSKSFDLKVEWEVFGQLEPIWVGSLDDNWDVSVYAESLGGGPEILIANAQVPKASVLPCTVNGAQPNCAKYSTTLTVAPNTLPEHDPNSNQSGIYKLAAAVFLNSSIVPSPGSPGFDLIGFSEGPIIQAENPE